MKGKKLLQTFLIISLFFSGRLFAEINVISPIEGSWGNKQMLVIEDSSEGDYFYSVSGDDPEQSGFAYDEPVLLDVSGDVNLKITKVSDSSREQITINYSVNLDKATEESYSKFISSFFDTGILNYTSGSFLDIPSTLSYAFGSKPLSFITGQKISLSSENILSRYTRCSLVDKDNKKEWSFVVKTFPTSAGTYSRKNVPFYITDWNNLTFTDKNLIYKIDTGFWGQPEEVQLDRTTSHMIYWQSIAYEQGNPVEFFVLPPKVELIKKVNDDGSVVFYTEGDESYSIGISSSNENASRELFQKIGIDSFYGERIEDDVEIEFFSSSVYQGSQKVNYSINKRPPSPPIINTDCNKQYSRKPVEIQIDSESDSELYVSIGKPYVIDDVLTFKSDDVKNVPEYSNCNTNVFKTKLNTDLKGTVLFNINAYCVNGSNKSDVSSYSVIIDQYNYFYDSKNQNENPDGTVQNPYNDFEECINNINKVRNAQLTLKGDVYLPSKSLSILSNLIIKNEGDVSLIFGNDTTLNVKSATLEVNGCKIICADDNDKSESIKSLIKAEKSVLVMNDCIMSAVMGKNGEAINGFYSSIAINNCTFSVNAKSYSSFLAGENIKGSVKNSKISLSGTTSLMFSLVDGDVAIESNSLKLTTNVGRIAEFVNSKVSLKNNSIETDISNKNISDIIHYDSKSKIKETDNEYK